MAVAFNGTTDYIDMGPATAVDFANNAPMSFMTWVNFSSLANTQTFVSYGFDGSNTGYQFQQGGGLLFAGSFINPNTHGTTWNPTTWGTSQWHHCYGEYTGNPGTQTWSIYIDGVFIVSTVDAVGPVNIGGRTFAVGAIDIGSGTFVQFFAGCLADVAVLNGPLTPTEISNLGQGLIRPSAGLSQALLGYWTLDTAAATQPDLSGNGNTGSAVGGAITNTCGTSPPYGGLSPPIGTIWM